MSLAAKLLSASGGGVDKLYVDDVFSAYTYTGNGATQTINNGIDLAGKGGMVWMRERLGGNHFLIDTARGDDAVIFTNNTSTNSVGWASYFNFESNGFALTGLSQMNVAAASNIIWTFRKAPKFFDVVTYTGTGANRTISHALGQEVGMILVKRTDTTAEWQVYHRSLANTEYAVLNTTAAKVTGATRWNSTTPTTSVFSVGTDTTVNASGGTYVAYLFAHDPSADGIVQCGSYVGNGATPGTSVTLGWEPQYVLIKNSSAAYDWMIHDVSRGISESTTTFLRPNLTAAEINAAGFQVRCDATGFTVASTSGNLNTYGSTYIYLAIRRPNKPPTTGTQVYNAIARTGTGAAATVTGVGFAPDLVLSKGRAATNTGFWDRLRGNGVWLLGNTTSAEQTITTSLTSYNMDGISLGADASSYTLNANAYTYITNFLKRAPGVFDIVCYTGTGVAKTEAHGLGVVPELIIVKGRDFGTLWGVYAASEGTTKMGYTNLTNAFEVQPAWDTGMSSTNFAIKTYSATNQGGVKFVAYLFATKAGISKVGSYTGNGSSQTIDCGFTTGARFAMIKRTDSTGDWYVWDTVRGLVAGNDPHLSLNTTAAEVTTNDSLDPANAGFIVNQLAATNINVTSATYIYLAFA